MADAGDGDKKKKKEKKAKEPIKSNLEVYDEVKMRFEVNRQTERAHFYESSYKELKKKSDIIKSQYYSQRETQADIMKDLNKLVEEQGGEVDRQKAIVEALHRSMDESEQRHKEELEDNDEKWSLKLQEAQTKMDDLQTALDHVKAYIKKRNELQEKLSGLEKELAEAHENHSNEISLLDRKKAVEIDQLKKDMLAKIRETRDSLRLKTKDQLDVITKRTIMENEQMSTELAFQSRETEKLIEKNKRLFEDNTTLRRNVQLHKELEEELAKRTHVYQRLIKRLNAKLEALEKRFQTEAEDKHAMSQKLQTLEHMVHQGGGWTTTNTKDDWSQGSAATAYNPKSPSTLNIRVSNTALGDPDNRGGTFGANSAGQNNSQHTQSTFSGPVNTLDHTFTATMSDGSVGDDKHIGSSTVCGVFGDNSTVNISNNVVQMGGSADNWALRKENQDLRRTLGQSKNDFERFKRDHRALLHLQDHTTRLIVLELYELKQQMERSYREHGSLESYFQRMEQGSAGSSHVFTMLTPRQRQMFFKLLFEKLSSVHSNTSLKLPSVVSGSLVTGNGGNGGTTITNGGKSPLANMAQSPRTGAEQRTTAILAKILTQIATENKGVQTMPITEPLAPDDAGVVPEWYAHAAQFRKSGERPGKHYRVNVVRGDVREWGGSARTMPSKRH